MHCASLSPSLSLPISPGPSVVNHHNDNGVWCTLLNVLNPSTTASTGPHPTEISARPGLTFSIPPPHTHTHTIKKDLHSKTPALLPVFTLSASQSNTSSRHIGNSRDREGTLQFIYVNVRCGRTTTSHKTNWEILTLLFRIHKSMQTHR